MIWFIVRSSYILTKSNHFNFLKWFNNVYVVELLGYTGGKVGILQSSAVRRDERIFTIRGKPGFRRHFNWIWNDSTCIDCNFWFTMIPLKVCIRYQCLWFWKLIIFNYGFPIKVACEFLLRKLFKLDSGNVSSISQAWNAQFTFIKKPRIQSMYKFGLSVCLFVCIQ